MPTYEYECLSCGAHFDAFQKMSDAPLDKCIKCKGSVRRIVSGGSGIIFKGSGFYITDYGKGKGKDKDKDKEKKPVTSSTPTKKESTTSTVPKT